MNQFSQNVCGAGAGVFYPLVQGCLGVVAGVSLCGLFPGSADADTLNLKNGNVLEGLVTAERADAVQFEEYGIKLWIQKSKIESIKRSSGEERSRQVKAIKKTPPKKVVYPSRAQEVGRLLNQLDAAQRNMKEAEGLANASMKRSRELDKTIIRLQKEMAHISRAMEATSPPEERNKYGAHPEGYTKKLMEYNRLVPVYQEKHAAMGQTVKDRNEVKTQSDAQSKAALQAAATYQGLSRKLEHAWIEFLEDPKTEAYATNAWFVSLGRQVEGHAGSTLLAGNQALKMTQTEAGMQVTVRSNDGNHFLIPVILNSRTGVQLVLDTGATMTVLSDEVAQAAGIVPEGEPIEVTVADGRKVKVRLAEVELFEVCGVRYGAEPVGIMEGSLGEGKDGLLGMTFLKDVPISIRGKILQMTLQ